MHPGALAIVLPLAALTSAAIAAAAFALSDGAITPDAGVILAATAGVLTTAALTATMAVGLAALTGSKAPVIAAMLAFNLALAPLLSGIAWLGDIRLAIPPNALLRIGDAPDMEVQMGLLSAIAVVLAWATAAFAAGAWRTRRARSDGLPRARHPYIKGSVNRVRRRE